MRFVTLKDENYDNCVRLVHLRDRNWQAEDIPDALLKDLFEDWNPANKIIDEKLVQELEKSTFSL